MYIVAVTIKVKPGLENVARFEEAIRKNHEATRQEPGNIRFDVLRSATPLDDPEAPLEYLLYEVYKDKEGFLAHQQTDHYFLFKDSVAELMAEPRKGVQYLSLFPEPWA